MLLASLLYHLYVENSKILDDWIVEPIFKERNNTIIITKNEKNINKIKAFNKLNNLFFKLNCEKFGFKLFELKKILLLKKKYDSQVIFASVKNI